MSNEKNNIQNAKTFEEIAEIREDGHRAYIRNGDNLEALLTGGYKDPTHFIFELLQNAEDALANEVTFRLFNDRLIFSHNGKKEFDLEDIKGITGIGKTTKKPEDNTIGKFGIGFKSVFTICTVPKIYSPDYCFELRNLRVPYKIDREKGFEKGTHFVLPFASSEKNVQDIYRLLCNAIENFNPDTLLFLRHIVKINYITPNINGFFEKDKKKRKCKDFTYYECKIKPSGSYGIGFSYLLFEKPLEDNEKYFISIAYHYNSIAGKAKIAMEDESTKLVVFFPTERETFLNFLVNGPFATTSTRENLSEKYAVENRDIMMQTAILFGDSLQCIKELGLITVGFIEKLPIKEISDSYYRLFYDETKRILNNYAILPTNNGGNVIAEKACIVGSSAMLELLEDEDLKYIFDGKENWLDDSITYDKTRQLRDYLRNEFNVKEVDFEEFMRTVKDNFFEKRNDEWLMKFYKIAGGGLGYRDSLKTIKQYLSKKFIRIENNSMCSPFQRGIKNVYLPSKINMKNTIKSIFCKEDEIKKFFIDIGIEPANTVDEIREFLETLKASKDETDYLENLKLIAEEYYETTLDKKKEIADILTDEICLLTDYEKDGEMQRARPTDVFMQNEGIETIYNGLPNILYVNTKLAYEADNNSNFKNFLVSIGINNSIKLVEKTSVLSNEEKNELRDNNICSYDYDKGYQIDKIDLILACMNKNKSLELWKAIGNLNPEYLKGEYKWQFHQNKKTVYIKSYFLSKLQKTKWLYNDQGELVSPGDIYYEDACKMYPFNNQIKENFDFKPDLRKTLPQEEQIRLDITDGIPLDILREFSDKYRQEQSETDFIQVSVDECNADAPITEVAFDNPRSGIDAMDLEKEEKTAADETEKNNEITDAIDDLYNNEESSNKSDLEFEKRIVARTISDKRKKIGKWGENRVFTQLKAKYKNEGYDIKDENDNSFKAIKNDVILLITHHNANSKIQPGYDITIKCGNEILKYIEVKSREGEEKEYFNVSGTQWEFARTLENYNEGEKYWIFIVTNAGTKESETICLCNPYKNWKDGKLDADPVCIKL